ncbi:zinc finger protein [Macleaya cordata]|uniref:Zinc finger protein n=1 Tax=Macleaya cordata TaxID=56857 RepID=A0A200R3C9_MACCD|nr:zinc finger protein [Macleaya cordata]
MAEEEEVLVEVEAVQSVYGDDCLVIQRFPPHLNVHIKPRTADDSSQQFVEAVLGLQAGPQYPKEPPHIDIVESKGLDEKRQAHLLNSIREKAHELSSCFMLVALCEEAVEALSNMNHPDGSCPLCLYPLVKEDMEGNFLPFMKLMSCFHCFHSECIIRWWTWLQEQNKTNPDESVSFQQSRKLASSDLHGTMNMSLGICPVCRMVFHTKDIEHVLDLVGTHSAHLNFVGTETEDDEELLQSEAEKARRQKFESLLKLQEENSGLIEPKRSEVLQPGIFLPEPVTLPTGSTKPITELQQTDPISTPTTAETGSSRSSNKPSTSERKNLGMRPKNRVRHPREQKKKWIKKEIRGNTE